ncbi:MAG: DNA primase [Pirellulales bacterium]|nr:DNA primase [Pirellulales bacterium]
MSLPADFDLKERVRSAVDIVDVIGATLELQPQGRNFVTRCPWHDDRRPSMTVNQQRQTWKCWPCDIGGDVFSFVMRRDGVDFPTALKTLAELAGIPIEQYQRGKQTRPGDPDDKGTLLAAMKLVCDAYFEQLDNGGSEDAKIARDYLAERGIDEEHRKLFRIGFAPDSWSFAVDLLQRNRFSGEVAHAASLAFPKRSGGGHVDMFRGRLMFPIHDLQDRPISLGGRVIPAIAARQGDSAGGKYINGRETLLFRKSHQLYGLQLARDAIRRAGQALVMEGYTDVVAARQAGVQPVVAVLGTALGEQHVKLLKRFAERVVLVLDGDRAGQRRADEVLELFVRANVDLRVLTLPEGSDPADYLAQHDRDAFETLVKQSPDALDHKLARLTAGVDVTRDTHAVTSAIDTMLGIVAKAPAEDGLRADQLLSRMAKTFDLKVDRLERRLAHFRDENRRRESARATRPARPQSGPRQARPSQPAAADPNLAFAESAVTQGEFEPASAAASPIPNPVSLQPIMGIDRDLFEALIERPELAGTAVEAVDPDWLESNTAQMLLSAYQDLELAGRDLEVSSLLLLIENEALKNVLVSLQARVVDRGENFPQSPEERLADVMTRYREREFSAEKSRQIEQLESASLPEEEEDALLKAMFDQEKARHKMKHQS